MTASEWLPYALMAASAVLGWIARVRLQPSAPPLPATPLPATSPDHVLLHLLLARAPEQVRQALRDAAENLLQDLVKPPRPS
jgi:hypothetical protein